MPQPIEFDIFLTWAKNNFTEIKVKKPKIRLHSIYCDDSKYHLWCRPHTGYYHCYKSDKRGTLYSLVQDVEKCSYEEAVDILGGNQELRYYEAKILDFFAQEEAKEKGEELPKFSLPKEAISIKKLLSPYKNKVMNYLDGRKLPPDGLYYCSEGDYKGRIVIPYYNNDGELVYFNARDITHPKPFLRYRGPESETGFKKEEVVWMSFFPRKKSKIYLTEGEFDAMTLNLCGFHGCATGGKDVSLQQIHLIRDYKICLAFDADPSGREAFRRLGWRLRENGIRDVSFVQPPLPYKDWNEMLAGNKEKGTLPLDPAVIRAYVEQNEKVFDEYTASLLNLNA